MRTLARLLVFAAWLGLVTHVSAQTSRGATAASYLERGKEWLAKGDDQRALADFELAIASDPTRTSPWLAHASVLLRQQRLDEAERDLNKALSIDPRHAAALNDRGVLRHLRDDLSGALNDYNEAIRLKPDFAKALINRGILHFEMERVDAAEQDFAEAIRIDPKLSGVVVQFRRKLAP